MLLPILLSLSIVGPWFFFMFSGSLSAAEAGGWSLVVFVLLILNAWRAIISQAAEQSGGKEGHAEN